MTHVARQETQKERDMRMHRCTSSKDERQLITPHHKNKESSQNSAHNTHEGKQRRRTEKRKTTNRLPFHKTEKPCAPAMFLRITHELGGVV
jgi:hypothetical protein